MQRTRERAAAPRRRRWLRALLWSVVVLVLCSVLLVLALRWLPPPTSAFMLAARLGGEIDTVDYRWVPAEQIAAHLPVTLVAAEDQTFPTHHGFDLASIEQAWEERRSGGRQRGASTISQQVAKNLFLWSGASWTRKGLEVWFTLLIETLWPKRRILEVYANIAEFGPGVYGAEAAAQRFFGKSAAALSPAESARLAAVLPNPQQLDARRPSPYVRERERWILRQVEQLGGPAYLAPLQ